MILGILNGTKKVVPGRVKAILESFQCARQLVNQSVSESVSQSSLSQLVKE